MYPLAEYCTPELSAVLGTIPLFFTVRLTVLVLLEYISLSSTIPCSEQSVLTHLFPYPSFYRSVSPPQASFRLVGPGLVHCSKSEKLLYFYLSLSFTLNFFHTSKVWRCRDLTCTQYSEGSTLWIHMVVSSVSLIPSERFLMLDLFIDCYGFLGLYFVITSKLPF